MTSTMACDGVGCCAPSPVVKSCCNGVLPTSSNDCCSTSSLTTAGQSACCTPTKIAAEAAPCCNVTIRLSSQIICDKPSNAKTCCSGGDCSSSRCAPTAPAITKTLTCLAIIRQQNSTVDIFDINGQSRTFRIGNTNKHNNNNDEEQRKLCFATHHGTKNETMIDGILTPCFNEYGLHDDPDEGCPCGVDEPHLHAHYHDPKICDINYANNRADGGCVNNKNNSTATGWNFLSQLTLPLLNNDGDNMGEKKKKNGVIFPVTDNMPKECNSDVLNNVLRERGLTQSQWLHWKNGTTNCCKGSSLCTNRQIYPVTHDDHTDYLIHNETTGVLHMEHPCITCGQYDIHGRFRLIHTRCWMTNAAANNTRINLHFFEEYKEPFRLLDVLSVLFEVESNRVHAASCRAGGVVDKSSSSTTVVIDSLPTSSVSTTTTRVGRSQFHVQEICCASEIPQIELILRPIAGIQLLSINPTVKMVYVDHNVDILSADAIAKALNVQGFGAVVKVNAATLLDQLGGIPTDVFVISSFDMTDIYNNTTEGDTGKISEVIHLCLDKQLTEKQVKNIVVIKKEMILSVEHNPYYLTAHGVAEILNNYMYDVKIVSDGGADGLWALSVNDTTEGTSKQHHSSTVRITVILSGIFWVISMLSYIGGSWEYLKYVALLSVACGLPHIAMKAFKTLHRCHFDVNCMMFLAASGALALQDYTESAAVVFLFSISEVLEQRATSRARDALSEIVSTRPEYANVINPITHDIVVLPVNSVVVGTNVSVRTGDKIPCDGEVIEGTSTVDESSLTGESRPITKSAGMKVAGGSINSGNTQLVIRTTAASNDSAVARLIRLLEEAQSNRSETEMMIDAFAKVYTPIVVVLALLMCTVPWAFGTDVGILWAHNGLVTIVIACPCALIISTPVTYVAGLAAVTQKGIVCKGGQHLEGMGRVKSIYFDKTGTLSEGVFALLHFKLVDDAVRSRKEVLGYLAIMEAPASHPLSDAIVKGAVNEQAGTLKLNVQNHTLLPGEGITAVVEGKNVHVGNKRLFDRLNLYENLSRSMKATTDDWSQSGGTVGFISIEGEGIVGSYCVADKIRHEAKEVVTTLKCMGIDINMITGDQRRAALAIGAQIGLEETDIMSEMLPEDKLAVIRNRIEENKRNRNRWMAKTSVVMVGDGVNDAPALALANVSVAMGEGAALAMQTADLTLLDSDLRKLLYVIRMGKRVRRTIIENISFSLVTKAIVMGFTFAGRVSLWAAIASDVGAMLIVTMNGMKLLPSRNLTKPVGLEVQYV